MNKLFTILFLFISLATTAQRVYSPSVDGVPGRNQPIGISGLPLDGRSQYHDTTISPAKWRDYQSVAEVNAYLNTATKRTGHFPIYIHSGGTLSAGVWTGGTFAEYHYIGTSDVDLVLKSVPSVATVQAATNKDLLAAVAARFFGDSMTYGTGGLTTPEYPGGVPFMEHLRALTGWNFFNYGVPGETSTQVRTRLIADSANKNFPTVIWAGTNNLGSIPTIKSDIAAMVAHLGHTRYLIIDLLGQNTSSYWSGTANNTAIKEFNTYLETTYPGHVIHLRGSMIDDYDETIPADTLAYFHNVWPPSFGADATHLNTKGNKFLAGLIAGYMDTLNPQASESKSVTTSGLKYLLGRPTVLGINASSPIAAKTLGINGGTLEGAYLTDGGGFNNKQVLVSNGGADFLYPNGNAGMRLRPQYANLGGYSTLELSGTGPAWTIGKGLTFRNDFAAATLGSDFTLNGVFTHSGDAYTTGTHNHTGGLYPTTLGIGSSVTHTALRPIDFSFAGNGMLLPFVYAGQHATKLNNGNTYEGESYYNPSDQTFYVARSNGAGYGIPKAMAFIDDLNGYAVSSGGLTITGAGTINSPRDFRLSALPTPGLLSGTQFGTNPDSGSPTNTFDKAFDGIIGTEWRGAAATPPNYVGLNLATSTVLTKLTYYPGAGLASSWVGAKIQGSNTSTTAGYTDLYTFTSAPTDFQYSSVNLSGTTAYKYFRLYAPSGRLDAAEMQFYGYVDTTGGYPRLTQSADSSKLYILRVNGTRDTIPLKTTAGTGTGTLYSTTGSNTDGAMTQAATSTALIAKGNVAGQTWTGTHVFPSTTTGVTAALGTSNNGFATHQFVQNELNNSVTDTIVNRGGGAALPRSASANKLEFRTLGVSYSPLTIGYQGDTLIQLAYGHTRGTPTYSIVGGAGTAPTVTISGNDVSGVIDITTGSTGTFGVLTSTLTFASPYTTAPAVSVTAGSATVADARLYGWSSTTFISIGTSTSLLANTSYKIYWHVAQ